jgi:hypothetical protein
MAADRTRERNDTPPAAPELSAVQDGFDRALGAPAEDEMDDGDTTSEDSGVSFLDRFITPERTWR